MDETFEIFTDLWSALLQERLAHQATLQLLARYEERAQQRNGTGGILEGRCKLCADPRGGIGQEYRASCPCQNVHGHLSAEAARLAKEPRRGKKVSENLFGVPPVPPPLAPPE